MAYARALAVLSILLLAAVPSPAREATGLEVLVQKLRPYEESLTYRGPEVYTIDELALKFHEIWQLASGPGSGKDAGAFAPELAAIAKAAWTAARCARHATSAFVLGRVTFEPQRDIEHHLPHMNWIERPFPSIRDPERPTGPQEMGLTRETAARTRALAARALDEAQRTVRLLSRFMRAFPLYREDVEWGPRP